jgi:aminoglycoside phosphotransferase (APT) family kinase protein
MRADSSQRGAGPGPADRSPPPPPASGVRLPWSAVPAALRRAVEADLGSRVVDAVSQPGGFSPGVAARLLLADGRRAFVKAVGPEPNPDSPGIHRAEARIAAALPAAAPAPRLLGSHDQQGWIALLFEDVDGRMPAQPWRHDELGRVLAALTDLAAALTPAPVGAPSLADRLGEQFHGWRRLRAAREVGSDALGWLDPWARRHLDRLAELEAGWTAAAAGSTLLHADLRADNLLLTPTRVVFVDWPWAAVGAAWVDLLLMLPSVRMQGGPDPEALFTGHPVARDAGRDAATSVLAGLTGFFLSRSQEPAPPGLPTVRAFQAAQGAVALAWLRQRTAWA